MHKHNLSEVATQVVAFRGATFLESFLKTFPLLDENLEFSHKTLGI